MSHPSATVSAAANIALVKYWGKQERGHNQPATASLSIGLEDLRTSTTVSLSDSDQVNSNLGEKSEARILNFVSQFRQAFEISQAFSIITENNFPTGSGLASSASGFAALTLAMNACLELNLSARELSRIALTGSGSAARSVYGGYAEVIPADEAYAISVMDASHWPLGVVIAITAEEEKPIGSTEAMQRTAQTSPYYDSWLTSHKNDMDEGREAVNARDFEKLAEVSEHNCLKMHAAIMTSNPGILYWVPASVAVMHEVREMRRGGIPAFFTIDAGPQVKVICEPDACEQVELRLASITGVLRTIRTHVGGQPDITTT